MGFKSWIVPELSLLGLKPRFAECEWGITLFSPNWSYLRVLFEDLQIRPHLFNLMFKNQNITACNYL